MLAAWLSLCRWSLCSLLCLGVMWEAGGTRWMCFLHKGRLWLLHWGAAPHHDHSDQHSGLVFSLDGKDLCDTSRGLNPSWMHMANVHQTLWAFGLKLNLEFTIKFSKLKLRRSCGSNLPLLPMRSLFLRHLLHPSICTAGQPLSRGVPAMWGTPACSAAPSGPSLGGGVSICDGLWQNCSYWE